MNEKIKPWINPVKQIVFLIIACNFLSNLDIKITHELTVKHEGEQQIKLHGSYANPLVIQR